MNKNKTTLIAPSILGLFNAWSAYGKNQYEQPADGTVIENSAGTLAQRLNETSTRHLTVTGAVNSYDMLFLSDYIRKHAVAFLEINAAGSEAIENLLFSGCHSLNHVVLPQTVSISKASFYKCSGLTTVHLPRAKTIGQQAFAFCDKLNQIDMPGVTEIGKEAFNECATLGTVDLP